MTVVCWNLCYGGGKRIARIVEELAAHDPDVIALTEFRAGPGRELVAEMRGRGWSYVATTGPEGNDNGIAAFSRTHLEVTRREQRWLGIELPECGLGCAVLHVMAANGAAERATKSRFWESILAEAEARASEPYLLLGNWNTGLHGVDESGKTFVCSEQFARLPEIGWTDLWRRHHPGTTEWTCRSKQNGFRLDHAFATAALLPRVTACRYSHAEREARVSSHSMTIVELDAAC